MPYPENIIETKVTEETPSSRHSLDVFFHPKSIAIIGATERPGSPGEALLRNVLTREKEIAIYPVNPVHDEILGRKAYRSISAVPNPDLAILATPAKTVPGIIAECVEAGVRGAIVISAGFREVGAEGAALEQAIAANIRGTNLRVIGPNCIGVMNPVLSLNASFARKSALPGSVAFISQSGALCTAILDWSLNEVLGFSAFVSAGSMLDVGWGDLIEYFGTEPSTESIVIYMESIGDASGRNDHARKFLEAAQRVARKKPIIVIKAGRTEAAAKAAASHTGTMTGSDAVLDAAFRRAGVLRIDSIGDLFHIAEVLAKQPRPKGRRLAIVTNAGGPGVLAADALIGGGGELAALSNETVQALNGILSPHWSHGNPIDILADATEETFERAVELALRDPAVDGVLALTAPLVAARPIKMAKGIAKYAALGKPLIASFMGGSDVSDADDVMSHGGIPTFAFPDDAARVFNYMWKYGENLANMETSDDLLVPAALAVFASNACPLLERVRAERRTTLTEIESKQVLACYEIPVVETLAATTAEEAVLRARDIGFPTALKLLSKQVTHKSDVGGVLLDLKSEEDVRAAFETIQSNTLRLAGRDAFQGVSVQRMVPNDGFELIVGSSTDPQFGPVMLVGAGGIFAEVMRDTVLELPPIGRERAQRMLERLRIWPAMTGARGKTPIDVEALLKLLTRFSELLMHEPSIAEIDINPLRVSASGVLALDARIVLHDPSGARPDIPNAALRTRNHTLAPI